jgi:hypothetical protein
MLPEFAFCTESFSANPATSPGTTVTLGASNADGSVAAIIGSPLTHDVSLLELFMDGNFLASTDTAALLDIVIDPAGGTSWDTTNRLIESIPVGHLASLGTSSVAGRSLMLPSSIRAGATIGALGRNVTGSTRPVLVSAIARGGQGVEGRFRPSQKIDAIGADRAASQGTLIAPSATANTFGSWTNIGSATGKPYRSLAVSVQGQTSSLTASNFELQIGISSTKIGASLYYRSDATNEGISRFQNTMGMIWRRIPSGTQLQARVRCGAINGVGPGVIIHGIS